MKETIRALIPIAILVCAALLPIQSHAGHATGKDNDDPESKPPVTESDVRIVQRARQILNAPSRWNRADTRVCPPHAKSFSLYCALREATDEVRGKFEHRGAAMQEARFVIDEIAPKRKNYNHRLMDYNNDPTTTFADVQKFFELLENRINVRLREQSENGKT